MTTISPHRRSLSESFKLHYLASLGDEDIEEPSCSLLQSMEHLDDHHPLVLAVGHESEPYLALEHRAKSESFICTAQGVVFEDAKSSYSSKLSNLMALAANTDALGTKSNVLLAKKALRYRKAMVRRRIIE